MNVLVDSSLFPMGLPPKSGHGRIWSNIFRRVPSNVEIYCNSSIRNMPTGIPKPLRWAPFPIQRPFRVGYQLANWTSYLIDRFVPLHLLAPSLYVPQEATLRLARRIPLVTILDDLTPETVHGTMPEWLTPKRRTLEMATIIISISESTKQLAMDHYNLSAEKFRVAPLASELVRPDVARSVRPHERPYFLVVGNRGGYKNFEATLRAFARLSETIRGISLVLAGPAIANYEQVKINALGLDGRIHHIGEPDDEVLAILYAHAVALVYPSLSEGFGIPPLEAMICGTVPIVSNRTSMPEVVGDAGIQVDPMNDEALAEAMRSLLEKPSLREKYVDRGLKRAECYSWDKTTDLIFAAWREAASV